MEASITAASQGKSPMRTSENEPSDSDEQALATQQAKPTDRTDEKGSKGSGAWKKERWQ